MPRWDPALHPRGVGGRFALVAARAPSGRGLPSNLRALQEDYRDQDPGDILSGRGRGDEIQRAYQSGKLWSGTPVSKFPAGERRALQEYQLDASDINGGLYDGGGADSSLDPDSVRRIDSAIERNQLAQDTVVYRGADSSLYEGVQEGDQVVNHAFSSTSLDPSVTRDFGDDMFEIELPEGTHIAPISRLGADEWGHQAELLVGRGAVIEIDEIIETDQPGTFDPSYKARVIRGRLVGYADADNQAPAKPAEPSFDAKAASDAEAYQAYLRGEIEYSEYAKIKYGR